MMMAKKHGKPTQPNRSGIATASDEVMTPPNIAKLIVERYRPSGLVLEPARGTGNIYQELPTPKDWCEITQGRDFFNYDEKVSWIITNPPYSIYDKFLEHCFKLADNVVFLTPIAKAFKSMKVEKMVDEYGGLKEIWLIGSGTKCGFAFGFPTGCLYYKRNYRGLIKRTVGLNQFLVGDREGTGKEEPDLRYCEHCGSEEHYTSEHY